MILITSYTVFSSIITYVHVCVLPHVKATNLVVKVNISGWEGHAH